MQSRFSGKTRYDLFKIEELLRSFNIRKVHRTYSQDRKASQPQLRFGDDVVLDFIGARKNRLLAVVEVLGSQRVDVVRAADGFLVPALLQRAEDEGIGVVADRFHLQFRQTLDNFGPSDLNH